MLDASAQGRQPSGGTLSGSSSNPQPGKEKLAEYEMGGIREYWVIDPEEQRADFYVLAADGRYERRRTDEDGIYPCEVIAGFRLREAWLWQQPLPKALSVLRELGVV